jgi:hypothetical protein
MSVEILPSLFEGRILHIRFGAQVSIEDLEFLIQYFATECPKLPFKNIHILYDVSLVKEPPSLAALLEITTHVNVHLVQWQVVYGAQNSFVIALAQLFIAILASWKLRLDETYAQALAFLGEVDPELGSLLSQG